MDDFNKTHMSGVYSSDRAYQDTLSDEIPRRTFNIIMGGTLGYGLLLNIILCKFGLDYARSIHPLVLSLVYLIMGLLGTYIARKSDNPLISFLGYNMLVVPFGLVLSVIVESYGGLSSAVVTHSFVITLELTALMAVVSVLVPDVMEKIGGFLMVALIAILVVFIIELILGRPFIIVAYISAGIFSLYIGYDIHKAQSAPSTVDSAVDSALDVYLDIINLFLQILRISGSKSKR